MARPADDEQPAAHEDHERADRCGRGARRSWNGHAVDVAEHAGHEYEDRIADADADADQQHTSARAGHQIGSSANDGVGDQRREQRADEHDRRARAVEEDTAGKGRRQRNHESDTDAVTGPGRRSRARRPGIHSVNQYREITVTAAIAKT